MGGSKRRGSADEDRQVRKPRASAPAVDTQQTPPPPAETPVRRRRASTRRADLNAELVTAANDLRASLREMIERYELRVGGQLAELIQRIEGDAAGGLPPRPLSTRHAQAMLEKLRAAPIKPRKGRAKDFRRLESLLKEAVAETLDD